MRRRLTLAIVSVAAGAVILFAVPLALVARTSYRDQELVRLQRDTVAATRAIDVSPASGDRIEVPPSSDLLAVYDRAGRRVAGRGPGSADAVTFAALRGARTADRVAGGDLVVAVPLVQAERVTGAVRAVRGDDAIVRRTRRTWLALAGLAVVLIAAAAAAAVLLGRRLARPLERLAVSARRLGGGDFTARSAPSGVPEVDAVGGALDATAERLDDLVARERAFSADASHQLRTPLAALRIELEAIELRGHAPPEIPAALGQVDRLQGTIDTLLRVARDERRPPATCDVVAVLDEAERRHRGALAASGRPLRVSVGPPRLMARVSAAVLGEILDVLLDNAKQHGAGAVDVVVRDLDEWLAVEVADEGPGFAGDPEAAFVRRTGSGRGEGIGLALARSLAQAEGGRLTVTRAGPNPMLTLVLPRAEL